jgi:hypothetical protein
MSWICCKRWVLGTVVVSQLACIALYGQPADAGAPPPMPAIKSPVDVFRELLAMTPEERKQFLTNRPPETRKLILAKVRSYESLKPEERELRLQATDLRWYLLPLMSTPATNRVAQLSLIPTNFQELVTTRLQLWDNMSPDDQTKLLKNEALVRYLTELSEQKGTPEPLSPERRRLLDAGVSEWQSLNDEQRQKIKERFDQFFTLTTDEKAKALSTFSEAERQQMEKTLNNYSKLSPAQRAACIRSFEKFTNLSLAERQEFLKNAERWKLMKPDERQEWRNLVRQLQSQPPPPPDMGLPPPPPGVRPRSPGLATNGN